MRYIFILLAAVTIAGCKKDREEQPEYKPDPEPSVLSLNPKSYNLKSVLPCKADTCTYVSINILEAIGGNEIVADSINKKVFNTVRSIVYFGEKPTSAKTYDEITSSFIKSYNELATKFPDEAIPWAAKIKMTTYFLGSKLINIKLDNFMYTGGAHGYKGELSLLFDAKTGKSLNKADLIKNEKGLTAYAEKAFREQYLIPINKSINSKGLMFEDDTFRLPDNIYFGGGHGVVLLYNPLEAGSFANGAMQLTLSFDEIAPFLNIDKIK